MGWELLLGAIIKLATWWLQSKDRARFGAAVREINRIAEASDAEIKAAEDAHDRARRDGDVGRM